MFDAGEAGLGCEPWERQVGLKECCEAISEAQELGSLWLQHEPASSDIDLGFRSGQGEAGDVDTKFDGFFAESQGEGRFSDREPLVDLSLIDRQNDARARRREASWDSGNELKVIGFENETIKGKRHDRYASEFEPSPLELTASTIGERTRPTDPGGHLEICAEQLIDRIGAQSVVFFLSLTKVAQEVFGCVLSGRRRQRMPHRALRRHLRRVPPVLRGQRD